jgi:hypothetical protein
LDDLGAFQTVRYINVEESPGSVSFAIKPIVINTVHTLALPCARLAVPAVAQVVDTEGLAYAELEGINAELREIPSRDFVTPVHSVDRTLAKPHLPGA